jgi:hypothetical protein
LCEKSIIIISKFQARRAPKNRQKILFQKFHSEGLPSDEFVSTLKKSYPKGKVIAIYQLKNKNRYNFK